MPHDMLRLRTRMHQNLIGNLAYAMPPFFLDIPKESPKECITRTLQVLPACWQEDVMGTGIIIICGLSHSTLHRHQTQHNAIVNLFHLAIFITNTNAKPPVPE